MLLLWTWLQSVFGSWVNILGLEPFITLFQQLLVLVVSDRSLFDLFEEIYIFLGACDIKMDWVGVFDVIIDFHGSFSTVRMVPLPGYFLGLAYHLVDVALDFI